MRQRSASQFKPKAYTQSHPTVNRSAKTAKKSEYATYYNLLSIYNLNKAAATQKVAKAPSWMIEKERQRLKEAAGRPLVVVQVKWALGRLERIMFGLLHAFTKSAG